MQLLNDPSCIKLLFKRRAFTYSLLGDESPSTTDSHIIRSENTNEENNVLESAETLSIEALHPKPEGM